MERRKRVIVVDIQAMVAGDNKDSVSKIRIVIFSEEMPESIISVQESHKMARKLLIIRFYIWRKERNQFLNLTAIFLLSLYIIKSQIVIMLRNGDKQAK